MTGELETTRRDFLALMSAAGACGLGPNWSFAQEQMPQRPIPTGDEQALAQVGFSQNFTETGVVPEISRPRVDDATAVCDQRPQYGREWIGAIRGRTARRPPSLGRIALGHDDPASEEDPERAAVASGSLRRRAQI